MVGTEGPYSIHSIPIDLVRVKFVALKRRKELMYNLLNDILDHL